MKTIYKYPLALVDSQEVRLPRRAELVHADHQGDALVVWAIVDPELPREPLEICIRGTGHPWPAGFVHFRTVPMPNGLVWHVGVEPRKVYR